MDQPLDSLVGRIIAARSISPQDTVALRELVWADGTLDAMEAEAIFALNAACPKSCPHWVDFFVEAISVHLVEQREPKGYVDAENAAWLIAQIGKDGKVETRAELLLLMAVFEKALNVDDALKDYAIAQVERVVLTGEGPTRSGETLRPGIIDEAEVTLLRRIFYAPASDGAAIISSDEAAALFRIKDATLGADNAAEWPLLFVQLVGNHLMAHQTYQQLSVDRAAELDRFMNDNTPNIGRFLSRMEQAFLQPSQIGGAFAADQKPDHDAAVAADRAMTLDEANWLKGQIVADGAMDDLEKALLAFIIDEAGPLPAPLAELEQSLPLAAQRAG